MYNRYDGNTGRVVRIDDGQRRNPRNNQGNQPGHPRGDNSQTPPPPGQSPPRQPAPPRGMPQPKPPQKPSVFDALGSFLPKKLEGLETEDLLLLAVLYLLYRESGDKEMLIIMGAMFLL